MNRVIYAADCLDILKDPAKLPDASIDLIYLDPPFNSNSTYNLPFKSRDRSLKPVEAFEDTWTWSPGDDERLRDLGKNPRTRTLAAVVRFAQEIEGARGKASLAAYLLNMAYRLYAMKRVLKDTGSIYLHCDSEASHYLKLLMDGIYGKKNYRSEIIWKRLSSLQRGSQHQSKTWGRTSDTILYYSKTSQALLRPNRELTEQERVEKFDKVDERGGRYYDDSSHIWRTPNMGARPNLCYEWRGYVNPHPSGWRLSKERLEEEYQKGNIVIHPDGKLERRKYDSDYKGVPLGSLWTEHNLMLHGNAEERLGYPTQKPLALMERIIKASSNAGDVVLDPFCGCGTTVHAAETLGRRWVGIDISKFSTGLIRRRIVDNFAYLNKDDIRIHGTPETIREARALAQQDKFEFEKWVCGALDANGMYKNPGEKGADGGVDGVVELPVIRQVGNKYESQTEYVIIQVKGGNVAADSVKALSETVRRLGAVAGIMVCFREQMGTVENQRSKELWADAYKEYPVIQGFSIESMLADERPNLPPTYGFKHGGKTSAPQLL